MATEKFEKDAKRASTRGFGGYVKDRLTGSADFEKPQRRPATAAPMGDQNVIDTRMKAAGEYRNGGMVKVGKASTPYKCGGKVK